MISGHKSLSLRAVVTALLILACFCFGGSASIPLYEMALSIFAMLCLLVIVWSSASSSIGRPGSWLIYVFVLLVAIQLMPLPYLLWGGLPHGQFSEGLGVEAQHEVMWKSLSIAPEATLYSFIAAAPALIAFWLVVGLNDSEQMTVANLLVVAVLFQAILGIGQSMSVLPFSIYDHHHPKVAIGLFASRNHFADLILAGTGLLFAVRQFWLERYGKVVSEIIFQTFLLLFLFAAVGSASRAGIIIFGIFLIYFYCRLFFKNQRLFFCIGACFIGILFSTNLNIFRNAGVLSTTLARFEKVDDARWEIWSNSWRIAYYYVPWGVGISNFRQVYEENEPRTSVRPSFINAAHNEYLQLLIETGAIGTILAVSITWVIYRMYKKRQHTNVTNYCTLALAGVMLHSFVDYPLRVTSLNVFIAALLGFIIAQSRIRN